MNASTTRESKLAELFEILAVRMLNGEDMDCQTLIDDNPELAGELRELESTVSALAAWGNQAEHLRQGADHATPNSRVLGDFRIIREFGRGGMGIVYEAEQLSLDRRVALKILPFAALLDEKQLRRFQTEARAAAVLHHDNIVSVYSVGCQRGVHYYAMQLIDGPDLAAVIAGLRSERSETTPEAARETASVAKLSTQRSENFASYCHGMANLGIQIANALHRGHQEGIVHRDIKPGNLLLDQQGRVHVTDFGLARMRSQGDVSRSGEMVGTVRYMSPEQIAGDRPIDQRSDVYSLGVTLYELIATSPAFPGSDRQKLMRAILSGDPSSLRRHAPSIPRDLETIILKAMSKEPVERYQTAKELADDLKRFLEQRPILARPTTQVEHLTRLVQRNPMLSSLCASVIALLCLLSVGGVGAAWKFANVADARARDARRHELGVYARDMRLVRLALEEGDFINAEQLLLKWAPEDPRVAEQDSDCRGFEWYHLWKRCHDSSVEHTISHRLRVNCLAFSPDGEKLLDGFFTRDVPIWDLATKATPKLWRKLPINTSDPLAAKTIDRRLILGDKGGKVQIWDWETGELVKRLFTDADEEGLTVLSVDLFTDENLLAVGMRNRDFDGWAAIWDLEHDREIARSRTLRGCPRVAFDHSGRLILSANQSSLVWFLDRRTAQLKREERFDGTVTAMAINADRDQLAVCVHDRRGLGSTRVVVCNVTPHASTRRHEISLGNQPADCASFSPTGDELAVGDEGGYVHRVSLPNESVTATRYHFGVVKDVKYSPEGKRIATGGTDCQTHLISRTEKRPAQAGLTRLAKSKPGPGYHVGFLDQGRTVCTTEGRNKVHFWDTATGQLRNTLELEDGPWNVVRLGADVVRNRLAIVRCNWPIRRDVRDELLIWDGGTEDVLSTRYDIPAVVATVVPFSPNGRYVGVPGVSHVTIVDLLQENSRRLDFSGWVKSCAFSRDGKTIACAPTRSKVRFFDVETLVETRPPVKMDGVSTGCIAFSPQDNLLASTGIEGRFHLFDMNSGKEVLVGARCPRYLATLAFSPDGTRIATGSMDGRVRVFSTITGDELFSIDVMEWYSYVAFSPDGEHLAISSGLDHLVVHAPNQRTLSRLSRSTLDDVICRDVTVYDPPPHAQTRK